MKLEERIKLELELRTYYAAHFQAACVSDKKKAKAFIKKIKQIHKKIGKNRVIL